MKIKFINDSGDEIESYIDENLKNNLDEVKHSVLKKGWDYVAVVSGIVGVGKSTFAQKICKYLDPTFNTKDRVCFQATGEKGFLERTSNAEHGQAFMLDESFADLNTKASRGSDFVKIINHLQLVRQKGLFLILCLPNFFDLSKGVAVFRASHLFVVYHDGFNRGYFAAFGRDEKRKLYVKGSKFMDYNAAKPNFRGRFTKEWICDEAIYEKMKLQHLKDQAKEDPKAIKIPQSKVWLTKLIKHIREGKILTNQEVLDITGMSKPSFYKMALGDSSEAVGEDTG